jgi:hypothetical protein
VLALLTVLLLGACATPSSTDEGTDPALLSSAWAQTLRADGADGPARWMHMRYGNHKPTRYTATVHQGRPAVLAESDAGNSTLRLRLAPHDAAADRWLRFSWQVPALNERADLRDADIDDAVVRVILTFDGDRSRLSPRDHMLSELANLVTGEPLPFATLMYVWDHRYPEGSVIPNPHTQRIRKLVVESGTQRLNQWVDVERDIEADYRRVFGEAPGALTAIGVMTDSNNTGEKVRAWFGPLVLAPSALHSADAAGPGQVVAQPAALSP